MWLYRQFQSCSSSHSSNFLNSNMQYIYCDPIPFVMKLCWPELLEGLWLCHCNGPLYMFTTPEHNVYHADKLKRTALMHACMNGSTTVASFLLNLGADPNAADTSGNTCLHYAAAYGWYHCLQLLLKAGADAARPNDWKVNCWSYKCLWLRCCFGLPAISACIFTIVRMSRKQYMTTTAIRCKNPEYINWKNFQPTSGLPNYF